MIYKCSADQFQVVYDTIIKDDGLMPNGSESGQFWEIMEDRPEAHIQRMSLAPRHILRTWLNETGRRCYEVTHDHKDYWDRPAVHIRWCADLPNIRLISKGEERFIMTIQ